MIKNPIIYAAFFLLVTCALFRLNGREGQSTTLEVKNGVVIIADDAVPVFPGVKEVEWAKPGGSIIINYAIPMKSFDEKKKVFTAIQRFYAGKMIFGVRAGIIKKLNLNAPPGEEGAGEVWEYKACPPRKKNLSILLIADQRQECAVYVTISNNCE